MSHDKKRTKRMRRLILLLGIVFGFGLILYPLISQLYYDQVADKEVTDFQEAVEVINPPELKEKNVQLAEAYNEALEPNMDWVDPYSEAEREEGVLTYAEMLEVQEKIGVIHLPTINVTLPVFAGTSTNVLQSGVGHLEGTSLPIGGDNSHSVLTAHRGLPEARLFTDLDQMEIGDVFFVETMASSLYYEVDEILVIEPTETDSVRIIPDKDYLTLLTCTPYMVNTHRLLVRGVRIPAPPPEMVEEIAQDQGRGFSYYLQTYWHYLLIITLCIAIVVSTLFLQKRKVHT